MCLHLPIDYLSGSYLNTSIHAHRYRGARLSFVKIDESRKLTARFAQNSNLMRSMQHISAIAHLITRRCRLHVFLLNLFVPRLCEWFTKQDVPVHDRIYRGVLNTLPHPFLSQMLDVNGKAKYSWCVTATSWIMVSGAASFAQVGLRAGRSRI